jgi:predicted RNase H-like HicB family nuclease
MNWKLQVDNREGASMIKNVDYYMSLPYRIKVVEDIKEGGFTFYCPDLPGCVTCAETLEEGYYIVEDAMRCWFEACIESEFPIPEPTQTNDFTGFQEISIDLAVMLYGKAVNR